MIEKANRNDMGSQLTRHYRLFMSLFPNSFNRRAGLLSYRSDA